MPDNTWQCRCLDAVPNMSRLEHLTLRNVLLDNSHLEKIVQARRLISVEIRFGRMRYSTGPDTEPKLAPQSTLIQFDERGFRDWHRLSRLETVTLDGVGSDPILSHLAGLTNLQTLAITRAPVTDAGLASIVSLTELESLRLDQTEITDAGLVHIGQRTQLQYLYLNDVNITDAGLAHLAGLTELTHLWLNEMPVGDAGLAHLSGMVQMQRLAIPDAQISNGALGYLSGMSDLRELKLCEATIDDGAGPYFPQWPKMEVLHLEKTVGLTDATLVYLLALPNLTHIYIQSTSISDAGKAQLRAAFPSASIW